MQKLQKVKNISKLVFKIKSFDESSDKVLQMKKKIDMQFKKRPNTEAVVLS